MKKIFLITLVSVIWIFSSVAFAFSVAHPADGIYSLQPKFAPGKELSVENHGTNWGANVIIDNINSGWRKWKVQRIAGTDFYSIIAVHSNLALDVANARAEYGVNIATWPYLDGIQNQFKFLDAGNGYYAIQANLNGSFVLDVERAENRAGANVLSWGFHGGDNQLWKLVKVQSLPTFQSYNKKATQKVTAYVMPDLQAKSGDEYVSAGDNVTVLREEGNAYLVRYPVRGGTKTRWVNKNEIFKGSNDRINTQPINNINHNPQGSVERVESPSPGVLHVRGKAYDLDNARGSMRLHVYVGGGAGSGAPSYEIRTDGNSGVFDDKRQVSRTGNQRVYIYALNDYGSGNNVEIWNGYVNIQGSSTPNGKLQSLIASFTNPAGQKWDNRESSRIGKTCFGFANYIFRELHGVIAASNIDWSNAYIIKNLGSGVSCRYSGSVNENTLHTLFQQCEPGDFIQATRNDGTGQHSMIFVSYDVNTRKVRLFDANFTTAQDNLIQDRKPTVHQFFTRFQKMSVYTK